MTEKVFLDSISMNPQDNDLRLVYADWLEERNDPRAELVRCEVAMHQQKSSLPIDQELIDIRRSLVRQFEVGWLIVMDRFVTYFMEIQDCFRIKGRGTVVDGFSESSNYFVGDLLFIVGNFADKGDVAGFGQISGIEMINRPLLTTEPRPAGILIRCANDELLQPGAKIYRYHSENMSFYVE